MKTLDAVALIRSLKSSRREDKEWLDEHGAEIEDLVYEEYQGKKEAVAMGCMVARTKYE